MRNYLIVDDEELNRTLVKSMITRYNQDNHIEGEIHVTKSGEEGLEVLNNQSIDVLVTDHNMGGMSGAELLKILTLERTPEKVIVTTGMPKSFIDDAQRIGLDTSQYIMLTKPYGATAFFNALTQ